MRHNRATRPGLYLCARDYAAIVLRSIALLAPVRYVAVRCSTLRVVARGPPSAADDEYIYCTVARARSSCSPLRRSENGIVFLQLLTKQSHNS